MSQGVSLIQRGLNGLGYRAGAGRMLVEDGIYGDKTEAAAREWLAAGGKPKAAEGAAPFWPHQSGVTAVFGPAGGPDATAGRCVLPFSFPLARDATHRNTSFVCHTKVAAPLTRIFKAAVSHYGEDMFRAMGLDQFGGCFNHRQMRGGSSLSMHSWGIAVDLDPTNNGLNTKAPEARFSAPEYLPFWRIVEAEGAVSLGRARNYDWMHFQFATL